MSCRRSTSDRGYSQHIEILVVVGIDADLAEVHRARVKTIDPRPRVTAVGRLEHAAVLKAIGLLAALNILRWPPNPIENG